MTTLADIQRRVGAAPDGVWGPKTAEAIWRALCAQPTPAGPLAPSHECIALVRKFEGCEKRQLDGTLKAYPDPASGGEPWTIGWGSTAHDIKQGTVWTQAQADARLAADIAVAGREVNGVLGGADATQAQFDALVAFTYNLGIGNLRQSTLLAKHKAGDYAGAAAQFEAWNHAGGKVMSGLTRRRAAERALYEGRA